jgi:tellurite resistance protein
MGFFKALGESIFGVTIENFQFRLVDKEIENIEVKILQAKGLIPILFSADLEARIMLVDITDHKTPEEEIDITNGNSSMVMSLFEAQQSNNGSFLIEQNIGFINTNSGWTDWVQLGAIPLSFLVPPKRGEREFEVIVFLQGSGNERVHFSSMSSGYRNDLRFRYFHPGKGYEDIDNEVTETNDLTIKIAVAIAMSEGSLDDAEGETIKNWITSTIEIHSEETKKELKKQFNKSFKDSYSKAKDGKLKLGELVRRFEDIADDNAKYKCLDLCYAVMAADGVAAPEELEMIEQISESLQLDASELSKIRDSNLEKLDTKEMKSDDLEVLLNIDINQSKDEIKKHLTKEFQKWNSRINTISNEKEKEKAQEMINLISKARRKYK